MKQEVEISIDDLSAIEAECLKLIKAGTEPSSMLELLKKAQLNVQRVRSLSVRQSM